MKYQVKERLLREATDYLNREEESGLNMIKTITPFFILFLICFITLGVFKGIIAYFFTGAIMLGIVLIEHIILYIFSKTKNTLIKVVLVLGLVLNCVLGIITIIFTILAV